MRTNSYVRFIEKYLVAYHGDMYWYSKKCAFNWLVYVDSNEYEITGQLIHQNPNQAHHNILHREQLVCKECTKGDTIAYPVIRWDCPFKNYERILE